MYTFAVVVAIVIFIVTIVDFSVFFLDKDTEKFFYDNGEDVTSDFENTTEDAPVEENKTVVKSEIGEGTEFATDDIKEQAVVTEPTVVSKESESTVVPKESESNNYAEQLFADMESTADDFASDIDTDELASLLQEEVYKSVKAEMK